MNTWKTYQLKDICSDIVDCVNKTAPISNEETPYKMLRTSNIRNGEVMLENLNCVTKEVFDKWTHRGKLKVGDIILTREAPLGEVGLVRKAENYFLGQRLVLLRADSTCCDNLFLLYALMFRDNKEAIIAKGVGSTILHLRVPECKKIEIKMPGLVTQKRISKILSAYDDLIENNQKQIKLLEEAAQRLYKEWFVDLHFPGYENVKIVDGVPEGWKRVELQEIVRDVGKREVKARRTLYSCYLPIDCIPTQSLTYSNMKDIEEAESSLVAFRKGDIIFGAMRPYFHKVVIAKTDGLTRTTCFVLNTKFKSLYTYVAMLLYSDSTIRYATQISVGTTMPYVRWNDLKRMKVVIPDQNCAQKFGIIIKPIFNSLFALSDQISYLSEARDRLLPKLMSGEIEV